MESLAGEGGAEHAVNLRRVGKPEAAIKFELPGCPILSASHSGRSISAVWPAQRVYAVYSMAQAGGWELVDKGGGTEGMREQEGA